jgi:transcription factor WhiB
MTAKEAPLTPCRTGLRCQMPGNKDPKKGPVCNHELHPDDFFEPDTYDLTDDEADAALAAYKPVEAKALWACKLDCLMRSQCLDVGMQEGPTLAYGIYGGYTAAQRRAVQRDITKRAAARHNQSDD